MRVLIVDDHPLNLKLLRVQLEAEGHEVREAANGAVALELLGIEPVDAVISDILMPQMDGFRLCLEIRKSEAIAHLPFILYTSTYSSPEDRQLAEIVGADRYVVKPAPARAIFDALRDATLIRREAPSSDPPPEADETFVLQQYSEALVVKLEEKNTELHDALQRLQQAHDEIRALNRDLERRVEQRTFALVAANRELEAFSYSVSHDLRAPLRAISGYCDILRTEWGNGMSEEAVSLLGRIGANTQKLNTLIEDLLHYSRLGRQALRIQPVNIQQLTQECLADLRNEREGRSVDIEIGELPPWRADIILLKQVLSNLISNALKYTGKTANARIRINACATDEKYVFCIADNGAGFDMRYAGKIFDVFQRLHSPAQFPGSGVGLAIVRRAIERHGGRCWAQAEPGKGAEFCFGLPARLSDE